MFKTISIADLINQNKQVDFLVDRFEDMVEPQNIEYPHKHNFYEIFFITKGNSKQNINYKSYSISENTLFFISPGQLHLFEEWDDIEGFVILFTEQFFLQAFQNKEILFELIYLDNLYEYPFLKIERNNKRKIQSIVDLLYEECNSDELITETIQALLLVLLKRIQKLFSLQNHQQSNKYKIVILKKFKKLVELNFAKNLPVVQYASLLNISAHQLNSFVKAISGKTTTEIVKERIILEAQQLLHFSELTVSQIADQLGFEDSSYFGRYFKKQVGLSPLDFRKFLS